MVGWLQVSYKLSRAESKQQQIHKNFRAPNLFGALQQDVGAVDVVLGELEGVSEGVVHVRLRCEVQDGVDLFLPQDVRYHVRRADVSLDELKRRETDPHTKTALVFIFRGGRGRRDHKVVHV